MGNCQAVFGTVPNIWDNVRSDQARDRSLGRLGRLEKTETETGKLLDRVGKQKRNDLVMQLVMKIKTKKKRDLPDRFLA